MNRFRFYIRSLVQATCYLGCLLLLTGCPGGGSAANDSVFGVLTNGLGNSTPQLTLRIITDGSGATDNVNNESLVVGQSFTLRAALFDPSDNYVEDAPVSWSLAGGAFPSGDLVVASDNTKATFTPSTIGSTMILASYTGSRTDVQFANDQTGTFTVTSPRIPAAIAKVSGSDAQTATVGSNLPNPLGVIVTDSFGQPVQGASVIFSIVSGAGTLLAPNPTSAATVVTDANGKATVDAQVGDTAGTNSNSYSAVVSGYSSINTTFVESSTPGAPAKLKFATQPSGAIATSAFLVQPAVQVTDANNNLVSLNSGTVTLAIQTGSGTLSNATATFSNGTAQFSNTSIDTQQTGLVLRATSDVTGSAYADAASFDVAAAPPGKCQTQVPGVWQTMNGGCEYIPAKLVFSSKKTNLTWDQSVWDSVSVGPAPDPNDYGMTNDYDPANPPINGNRTDGAAQAVCSKGADGEGGYSDWRMPTLAELSSIPPQQNGPWLNGSTGDETVWTSSSQYWSCSDCKSTVDPWTGNPGNGYHYQAFSVYCVRKDTTPTPASIKILSRPNAIGLDSRYSPVVATVSSADPIVVQLMNSDGKPLTAQNVTVTVASTSLGNLGGTVSATTDALGRATLSGFTLDTVGTANLTIQASNNATNTYAYTISTTMSLKVGPYPHTCAVENSTWKTNQGGCQYMSGLVYSLPSSNPMTWHDAVWDSTTPVSGAAEPQTADDVAAGRTHDTANLGWDGTTASGERDSSYAAYCHDLREGGFDDWRVPNETELENVYQAGGVSAFGATNINAEFWSNTTWSSSNYYYTGSTVTLSTGSLNTYWKNKTDFHYVICVRNGTP